MVKEATGPQPIGRAVKQAAQNLSGEKRGLCKLICREPRQVHCPGKERTRSLIASELRATIAACVAGESPWPLLLYGPPGTGKSCSALCLLDMTGGHYSTVSVLCEQHNDATFRRLEIECWPGEWIKPTPQKFRKMYLESPPLLVLDEIGGSKEKVSDTHREIVKYALDARIERGKPMVLISNNTSDELLALYGAPIYSRLASGTVLEVKGDDRRLS